MAHSASLTWTASTDAGAAYNIYKSQVSGLYAGSPINASPVPAGTVTFSDGTITPGTWFYVVTALLNGAESVHSNEVKAVLLPSPPSNLALQSIS